MFFLLPVGVEYRASRQPMATFTLMGICVGFFLLSVLAGLVGGAPGFKSFFLGFALIPKVSHVHAWLTSVFMHAGIFHLLGNMVYLYLFGSCVEDILGRPKYVAFFLGSGVFANLSHVLFVADHFQSEMPIVGASGAICACMGAFAVLLRKTRVEFRLVYFVIVAVGAREIHLPSWLVLSCWFVLDVLGMIGSAEESGAGVAFAAHVGGFLLGAGVGAIVRARGWRGDVDEDARPSRLPTRAVPAALRVGSAVPAEVVQAESRHFIHTSAGQAGPFPRSRIREMLAIGSLGSADLYWDEVGQSWRPVSEL